jgi:hypothetical protein
LNRNTPIGFDGIAYSFLKRFGRAVAFRKEDARDDKRCSALVLRFGAKR